MHKIIGFLLNAIINPIPNTLDFHLKKLSKKEISKNLDNISKVYYKLYKAIETFEDFKPDIFNEHCSEYPDRKINMSTVISVLYVSGFSGEELYNKAYAYMNKTGK